MREDPRGTEEVLMAGTGALRLGLAARRLISPERWTDGYPGPVAYSRELDVLLDWANKRNYLKRFVPNIETALYPSDDPQAAVEPGSFPRIFGVSVHAYLVYIGEFSTHIWCTFTHIWCIEQLHPVDSADDARRPVYLYGHPLWIACSSGARCAICHGGRAEASPSAPLRGKGACCAHRESLGMCGADGRSNTPPSSISSRRAE